MTVSFMYNFRGLLDKFPSIFRSLIFHFLHPRLGYYFVAKREPKLESKKFSLDMPFTLFPGKQY